MQQNALASVGFVFVAKDRLIGIDLDHCRNPETCVIAPWALKIIERTSSYADVSPSGTGVHVIASGDLPRGGRKKDKIEMYCDGRFFTMTGHRVDGTPGEPQERSGVIAELHREVFGGVPSDVRPLRATAGQLAAGDADLVMAAESELGEGFRALWRGDHSSYPSQSEGDLALCGMLGRITNRDPDAIDRLFRHSGLMRVKWDSRRGKSSYGHITIRKALQESSGDNSDGDSDDTSNTIAQQLVQICEAHNVDLFHDDRQESFATIPIGEHRRTYRLRDHAFRRWLSHEFYKSTGRVASATPLNDACNLLTARATFDAPLRNVYLRIGEHEGATYLDLGDEDGNVVEVTKSGWRVAPRAPIPFRRPPGMRPLPMPIPGGSIRALRPFVNCSDDEWPLILGWLIGGFRVHGPFAILVILGEHGSAKSTLARVLKRLIDPNAADLRTTPIDSRDLMIGASNCWTLAFDNLSYIKQWLSDDLCRLATGGGFTTRSLYTNDEESIFDSTRPQLLNGIEDIIGRSDLNDRSIRIEAPRIPEERRKAEKQFWAEFDEMWPSILDALLDAISIGLRREPEIQFDSLPRMADFAKWVCACEPGLGLEPGAFMAAYEGNRGAQVDASVESCPAAQATRVFIESEGSFEGTATELLALLSSRLPDPSKPPPSWPKDGTRISGDLRRAAPDLRAVGIEVDFSSKKRPRKINIYRLKIPPYCEMAPPESDHQPRDNDGGPAPVSPRLIPAGAPPPPDSPCSTCANRRFWWKQSETRWTCWMCCEPKSYIDLAVVDVKGAGFLSADGSPS